jgi:rod shape-determining protein MreC
LRELLGMHQRLSLVGQGAEVLYDVADPYSRKVIIDHGLAHGTAAGSAVLDSRGVLGQVTRVHPMTAEVTLLIDRNQAIPVLNTRTGQRALAYGLPTSDGGHLELRYLAASADIEVDDLLTTSGVDGVYPAGLPVARVVQVSRDDQSGFARVVGKPLARMDKVLQVLVVAPVGTGEPVTPKESTP